VPLDKRTRVRLIRRVGDCRDEYSDEPSSGGREERFGLVIGARRGANRLADSRPPAWWQWSPPHHQRLSRWLGDVIASGYVGLEVCAAASGLQYTCVASRPAGCGGTAVLDIDAAAELWLEDHWPAALISGRDATSIRGWLRER
jgi:hypothetical protein